MARDGDCRLISNDLIQRIGILLCLLILSCHASSASEETEQQSRYYPRFLVDKYSGTLALECGSCDLTVAPKFMQLRAMPPTRKYEYLLSRHQDRLLTAVSLPRNEQVKAFSPLRLMPGFRTLTSLGGPFCSIFEMPIALGLFPRGRIRIDERRGALPVDEFETIANSKEGFARHHYFWRWSNAHYWFQIGGMLLLSGQVTAANDCFRRANVAFGETTATSFCLGALSTRLDARKPPCNDYGTYCFYSNPSILSSPNPFTLAEEIETENSRQPFYVLGPIAPPAPSLMRDLQLPPKPWRDKLGGI